MTAQEVLALRVTLLHAGYSPIPLFGKVPPAYGKNNARKRLDPWQRWATFRTIRSKCGRRPGRRDQHRRADAAGAGARPGPAQRGRRHRGGRFRARALRGSRLRPDPDRTGAEAGHPVSDGRAVRQDPRQPGRAQRQRAEKIEFLADGQQVACFGIHPETKRPYSWHKSAPGEIAREDLPYIREAEARALVHELAEMLVADFGYVRAPERPRRKKNSTDAGTAHRRRCGLAIPGRSHPCRRSAARLAARPGRQAGDLGHGGRRRRQLPAGLDGELERAARRALARAAQRDPAPGRQCRAARGQGRSGRRAASSSLPRQSLAEVHAVFKKWFGTEYDLDAATAAIAAAASERLPGDPLWLLIVAGPGGAKTETVQALAGCRCLCHQHDRQRRRAAVGHAAQAAAARRRPAACCARSATTARW